MRLQSLYKRQPRAQRPLRCANFIAAAAESGVRRKYYTVVSGFCSCLSFAEEVLMSDVTLKGTPMAAMRGAQSSTSPTGAGAVGPIDSCKVAGIRPGWRRYVSCHVL